MSAKMASLAPLLLRSNSMLTCSQLENNYFLVRGPGLPPGRLTGFAFLVQEGRPLGCKTNQGLYRTFEIILSRKAIGDKTSQRLKAARAEKHRAVSIGIAEISSGLPPYRST